MKPNWKVWRVQSDDRGQFDELVINGVLHLEMMTDKGASLIVESADPKSPVMFSIYEEKGIVRIRLIEGRMEP